MQDCPFCESTKKMNDELLAEGLHEAFCMVRDDSVEYRGVCNCRLRKSAPPPAVGDEEKAPDHETIAREYLKRTSPNSYNADSWSNRDVIAFMAEGDKEYQRYYHLFHKAQGLLSESVANVSLLNQDLESYRREAKIFREAAEAQVSSQQQELGKAKWALEKAIEFADAVRTGGENRGMGWTGAQHARIVLPILREASGRKP